jgi:hypothetical protein
MTRHEPRPVDILRPAAGDAGWATVRAGIPDRAVPRPVTWLRTTFADSRPVSRWAWDADWDLMAGPDPNDPECQERIYVPMDQRTALHVVQHPALGQVHVALHGDEVDTTAAALVADLGGVVLDGPPAGWERTAP